MGLTWHAVGLLIRRLSASHFRRLQAAFSQCEPHGPSLERNLELRTERLDMEKEHLSHP